MQASIPSSSGPLSSSPECPNCGKHSIVSVGGEYHCLSCDFHRNFDPPPLAKPNSFGNIMMTLLMLLLLLALV